MQTIMNPNKVLHLTVWKKDLLKKYRMLLYNLYRLKLKFAHDQIMVKKLNSLAKLVNRYIVEGEENEDIDEEWCLSADTNYTHYIKRYFSIYM
jgi:hypothetical protein